MPDQETTDAEKNQESDGITTQAEEPAARGNVHSEPDGPAGLVAPPPGPH